MSDACVNLYEATKGQACRVVSLTTITVARMYKRPPGSLPGEAAIAGRCDTCQDNRPINPFWSRGVLKGEGRGEGFSFRPTPLWNGYGVHVDQHFVRHIETGVRYLKFLPTLDAQGSERIVRRKYFYRDTFGPQAEEISNVASVERWLVPSRQPKTQQTRRPVRWKCITVENVVELSIARQVFSFVDAAAWAQADRAAQLKRAA